MKISIIYHSKSFLEQEASVKNQDFHTGICAVAQIHRIVTEWRLLCVTQFLLIK